MSCKGKKAVYTSSDAGDSDHAPVHYFAIASVNVGLETSAFTGQRQQYHLRRIEKLVKQAMWNPDVLGIAFCEVGNPFEGLHEKEKQSFESTVRSGFSNSGFKLNPTILLAPRSSFVTALRADVQI